MKIKIAILTSLVFTWFIISLSQKQKDDHNVKNLGEITTFKKITHPMSALREELSKNNPYKHVSSKVFNGTSSKQENELLEKRKEKISNTIKKVFNRKIKSDEVPNIGICISGGGYRAMIGTLGFLSGLQEENLLDMIEYVSVLSGSSWAISGWISSEQELNEFAKNLKNNIKNNPLLIKNAGTLPSISDPIKWKKSAKNFAAKYAFFQPLSSVDLYGAMVANNILKHKKDTFEIKLSDQKQTLEQKTSFMPIYTAISPISDSHPLKYYWYEVNPYVVRNIHTNNYVSTWAFGRKFENRKSIPSPGLELSKIYPPELPLSNYMGIFGSAYTTNIKEAVKFFSGQIPDLDEKQIEKVDSFLKTDEKILNLSNKRITVAEIYNPEFKIEKGDNSNKKIIPILDGGADFNMPIAPLLIPERKMDIIIMFDITGEYKPNTPALRGSEKYAQDKKLNFPKIVYDNLAEKTISIFEGNPTIIYIPFINNCLDKFCSTINFSYKEEEFDYVFNRAKNIIQNNKDKIKETITKKFKKEGFIEKILNYFF